MQDRPYFSARAGRHPSDGRLDLPGLRELFLKAYAGFKSDGYFRRSFGWSQDDEYIPGSVGDVDAFFLLRLRKQGLWPIEYRGQWYTSDDVFDVIELLHDCVSKGRNNKFDQLSARNDFRRAMNQILRAYESGYELTTQGEIVALPPAGLGDLDEASDPPGDPAAVQDRVRAARDKFRRRGSTVEDRRDAVRDLADVLEYLRPQAKAVLNSKDEADLFELANNFGIRHHRAGQKTNYDLSIWLSWAYYYYLATIHAVTRLIEKGAPGSPSG